MIRQPALSRQTGQTFSHPDFHRRLWSLTRSTPRFRRSIKRAEYSEFVGLAARLPYHRSGISPCPEGCYVICDVRHNLVTGPVVMTSDHENQ